MKKVIVLALVFAATAIGSSSLIAQCGSSHKSKAKKVAHHQPRHASDIVGVAAGAADFSTLVAAVKAADLVSTLQSDGPFTVFAPSNSAFAKIPEQTLSSLLEPKAKSTLTSILTYHVLPVKLSAAELIGAIKASGGEATLQTVNGGKLFASISGDNVVLKDEKGVYSAITVTDIGASNGVIHQIDTVVMPK